MIFQRGAIESSPARLVDHHLARAERLHATGEKKLAVERHARFRHEFGSQLGSRSTCGQHARPLLHRVTTAKVDVAAVGFVQANDVHDRQTSIAKRLEQRAHAWQNSRCTWDLQRATIEHVPLRVDRYQCRSAELRSRIRIAHYPNSNRA